jgi:hypothetical protein
MERIPWFLEPLFSEKKTFIFLERVLGDCHLHPHSLKEYSKRSKQKIRPETSSNRTRRAQSNGMLRFLVA